MVQQVKMVRGSWNKTDAGCWDFRPDQLSADDFVFVYENQSFSSLVAIVRMKFDIDTREVISLTYRFPECMLGQEGKRTPPIDVLCDSDVEVFMGVRVDDDDLHLCVTLGAYNVERYKFLRRSNFSFGAPPNTIAGIMEQICLPGAVDDLWSECILVASQEVMEGFFNPDEMKVMHTVHNTLTQSEAYESPAGGVPRKSHRYSGGSSSMNEMTARVDNVIILNGEDDNDRQLQDIVGINSLADGVLANMGATAHGHASEATPASSSYRIDKGKGILQEDPTSDGCHLGLMLGFCSEYGAPAHIPDDMPCEDVSSIGVLNV